jgi:hypothetical protein
VSRDELRTGCVIRFPYLWVREAERGETEGRKPRPVAGRCADHQTKEPAALPPLALPPSQREYPILATWYELLSPFEFARLWA